MENKEKYIQRIKKLLAMARNNSSVALLNKSDFG